jgi:stalled ribosome rescue protein Dom34
MSLPNAVVWIDHHNAKVLQFDAERVAVQKVQAHSHDTGHHGSAVHTELEFFTEVCDELGGIQQVVVTGSQTALSDFRHHLTHRHPALATHIVGWETVNHPSEAQLVAFARQYFFDHERLAPAPPAP